QPIDQSLIRKPYSEVAHFSVEKPAQFRVETNSHPLIGRIRYRDHGIYHHRTDAYFGKRFEYLYSSSWPGGGQWATRGSGCRKGKPDSALSLQ
ncbi:hypothetical protein, partial [Pseudochelatococcus contaminans]|uniref:hypothetical protein n=1 Tax=Pseudochelatococcus contaminans TaxID=1538103 RepID=UPI001AEEE2E8